MSGMIRLLFQSDLDEAARDSLPERFAEAEAAARETGHSLEAWLEGTLGDTAAEMVEARITQRLAGEIDTTALRDWYHRFRDALENIDRYQSRLWQPVGQLDETFKWAPGVPDEGFSWGRDDATVSVKPAATISLAPRDEEALLHATARLSPGQVGLQHRFLFGLAGDLAASGNAGQVGISLATAGEREWRTRYLTRHPADRPLFHAFLSDLRLMPAPFDTGALLDGFRTRTSGEGLDGLVFTRTGTIRVEGKLQTGYIWEFDGGRETPAEASVKATYRVHVERQGDYKLVLSRLTEEGDRLAIRVDENRISDRQKELGLGLTVAVGGAAEMAREYLIGRLELAEKTVRGFVGEYAELSQRLKKRFQKPAALGNSKHAKALAVWLELEPNSPAFHERVAEVIADTEDRIASRLDRGVDEAAERLATEAADALELRGELRDWFKERSAKEIRTSLAKRAEDIEEWLGQQLENGGSGVLTELHGLLTGAHEDLEAWRDRVRGELDVLRAKLEKRLAHYRRSKQRLIEALDKAADLQVKTRLAHERRHRREASTLVSLELDLRAARATECLDWLFRGRLDRLMNLGQAERHQLGIEALTFRRDLESVATRQLSFELNVGNLRFSRETILEALAKVTVDDEGRLVSLSSSASAFDIVSSNRSHLERGFEVHFHRALQDQEALEGRFAWDLEYYNKSADQEAVVDTLRGLRTVTLISGDQFNAARDLIVLVAEQSAPDQIGFAAELAVPIDAFFSKVARVVEGTTVSGLTADIMGILVETMERFEMLSSDKINLIRSRSRNGRFTARGTRSVSASDIERDITRHYSRSWNNAKTMAEGFFTLNDIGTLAARAMSGEIGYRRFKETLESLNEALADQWQQVNESGFAFLDLRSFLLRAVGRSNADQDLRLFRLAMLFYVLEGAVPDGPEAGSGLLMLRVTWWDGDERHDELITP